MNRARWLTLLALALLLTTGVVFAGNSVGDNAQRGGTDPAEPVVNLLDNPSFEGGFHTYDPPGGHPDCPLGPCQTVQIADDWNPWWVSHDPSDPGWIIRMPEYKPAAPFQPPPFPDRIHTGSNAQQYFTFHSTHQAGIYQRVSVQEGQTYRFKIWGHSWASDDDNPETSNVPLFQKIGIDPNGGTNWESSNVVWGPPHVQHDEWGLFTVCAKASSDDITVFTFSEPEWAAKHNDVYWDTAILEPYNGECQLGMEVSPNEIDLLVESDKPVVSDTTFDIKLPDEPGITWQADLQPGGTLTPTLSASSGSAGQDLIVTVDSNGLPFGEYAVNLVISSDPPVPGNPKVVPIKLEVVPEIILSLHVLPSTIGYIVDIDDSPGQMSTLAKIKIPYKPGITWKAEILPGWTISPTLSAISGAWGENITVTLDATGLPVGLYSADLRITTDPSVPGNPVTVPIFLLVAEEVQYRYLPMAPKG